MRGLKYILCALALIMSVSAMGQYNPSNPAEPGAPVTTYSLTLQADPSGGGSFNLNAVTSYTAGTAVNIRAYTASNFVFVSWEEDGTVISNSANITYTMPAHNARLIAHYRYNPSAPAEPSEPVMPVKPVYSKIYLTASPAAGGSFNITSGNSYEVGTTVKLQANPASNFRFLNWAQDGEIISESRSFNYVILEGATANSLTANFSYEPGSPSEPSEPAPKKIYHRVYLQSDPAGGGYFNVESGNQYEEGSMQTFRAYNNQWYTFQNWTLNGEVISTSSSFSYAIPTEDVTLTAHYTYNYNPGNPNEPGQAGGKHLNIYGMTATGALGQNIIFPVLLENTEDFYGVTVVLHFPEVFTLLTGNVMLGERAAGHTMTVTPLEDNAYRFDLDGDALLAGSNGKIFEIPVTISDQAKTDSTYQVRLTNGARLNQDGSKDVINARSGYIYVEQVREDGLYAQFSYEKLHSRVKFTNLSSDKALSFMWDFGDGTTSTERAPLHVYEAPGYYDVRLTATGTTGTEVAVMTVLINDENTWNIQGTFFMDEELTSVRSFATQEELMAFLASKPIVGNVRIALPADTYYYYDLAEENIAALTAIKNGIVNGGYTLTLAKDSEGQAPVMTMGIPFDVINADVVNLFAELGTSLVLDDTELQLWGINFIPSGLQAVAAQTVLSGQPTAEVDFTQVSPDLTFSWSIASAPETATDYPTEGTGNIPSMTAVSGSADECALIYNIIGTRDEDTFVEFTHTVTLRPALEGRLTELSPANGSDLESTTVLLTWNSITNAVYDVYLWNAANQRPTTPVAEGISELSFLSQNFCQVGRTYNWYVVARNAVQRIESEVMSFAINILPDLHVTAINVGQPLEAGQTVDIEWTVRNDGRGATGTQGWTDRLWLVPDVYSGTNHNQCRLLATVDNAAALAPGEQYTQHVEVAIDEKAYGNYYVLAAADMSSVTLIDWISVGGTIVNPYTPVVGGNAEEGTYPFLFATNAANGNQLRERNEVNNRSDNFFYKKVEIAMPQMDEADWQLLQTAYEEMSNGESWTTKWNFNVETHTVLTLPGVRVSGGHVFAIDLHDNGLTGAFPMTLLSLPELQTLNLSGNSLDGNLPQAFTTIPAKLSQLNISNNQLAGNIGGFAAQMPALTTLIANGNCLEDVMPMIAPKVTTLNLGSQMIDKVVTYDLANSSAEEMVAQIPTILLYNHSAQKYNDVLHLLLTTGYDDWAMQFSYSNGTVTFPYVSAQNDYHGEKGDTLRASVVDNKRRAEGSAFYIKLLFGEGDANFNGKVDVTDLQAQINYAFEAYNEKPFNFTAANLWRDEVINVQDVVLMVDQLLRINVSASREASAKASRNMMNNSVMTDAQAVVYLDGNSIILDTNTPVAAFEMTLSGDRVTEMSQELEQMGFKCRINHLDGITRIVGYSMNGATIPVGTTAICQMQSGNVEIVNASLSDIDAEPIGVSIFVDTTTTISDMTHRASSLNNADAYDMSGRKISGDRLALRKLSKGIYIVNGKKIVNM